jgi:sugar lactone lactonase YvrE
MGGGQEMMRIGLGALLMGYAMSACGGPVFPTGSAAEKLGDGFLFTEGPCWRQEGYLVFSDINGDKIYKWTPDSGCKVFLTPSGNTNGIARDSQGRLILAQQGLRRVVRLETDGSQTILASSYNGKKLNSPNDIAVRSDGMVYFTDPPYGVSAGQRELGFCGVYRCSPSGGDPVLLVDSLAKPNGLEFSPDESLLYIADTDAGRILAYRVQPDGSLTGGYVFAALGAPRYTDGFDVDASGILFCAGAVGRIYAISQQGAVIDSLAVPAKTTNVQWGGSNGRTLFVTSGTALFRIVLGTAAMVRGADQHTCQFTASNGSERKIALSNRFAAAGGVLRMSGELTAARYAPNGRRIHAAMRY